MLASLRPYIENHARDSDISTPAHVRLKISTQSSTSLAPFELVLSRALGPISANVPQPTFYTPIEFKQKGKQVKLWQTSSPKQRGNKPWWSSLPLCRPKERQKNETPARSDRWPPIPRNDCRQPEQNHRDGKSRTSGREIFSQQRCLGSED